MAHASIQKERNRLTRNGVFAMIMLIVATAFSFIDSLVESVSPRPDYYKVLMRELAHQHYLATGTTTIVKENDLTREFFEQQYNLRNRNNGLDEEAVRVSKDELLSFSYLPWGRGLLNITIDDIILNDGHPQMKFTQPSGRPVALWIYSRRQNLLAAIFYELPEQEALNNPGKRMFQTIDRMGVIAVQGDLPESKLTPVEGYLLSLGDLKLGNLSPRSKLDPELHNLDWVLPVLFDSALTDKKVRPRFSDPETVLRMRREAGFPFFLTRAGFRYLLLPVGLLWLIKSLWDLRRLRHQYDSVMEAYPPAVGGHTRIGLIAFLYSNLDRRINEVKERRHQLTIAQREEAERRELKRLLQEYRSELELHPDEAKRFEEIMSGDSLDELRKLRDEYQNIIQQRRQQIEAEQQQVREREREIQRLESELESVPAERRDDEGREAWTLYQQALNVDDPKAKLALLKEARKKIPKEFRPDRF